MACNEIQVFINSFVVICVWVGMSDIPGAFSGERRQWGVQSLISYV